MNSASFGARETGTDRPRISRNETTASLLIRCVESGRDVKCQGMVDIAWSSLADELVVAADLFGSAGSALVASWLEVETSRVSDDEFAAQFYRHLSLPGVLPSDYLHRVVCTRNGKLLGGIRFRNRDVNRPFVEIIAHGFDDLDRLRCCVRDEWSMFRPKHLRLCVTPGHTPGPNSVLDLSIYVARYKDMLSPDQSVRLIPFPDPDHAIAMVRRRYEHMAKADRAVARNVFPASPDDIRHWHYAGQLQTITIHGSAVGALAVAPGAIRWISGDEIQEEVIEADHGGYGYAALAQAAWASSKAVDPNQLLIGTIDGRNVASHKTATRARRRRVLDWIFIPV